MTRSYLHRGRSLVALFAALGLLSAAQAAPLVWTLSNVTFTTGGGISGSFSYDAQTNTYSDVNLVTTGGTLPGKTFTIVPSADQDPRLESLSVQLIVAPVVPLQPGDTWLVLFFEEPLTRFGGTVSLRGAISGNPAAAGAEFLCQPFFAGCPFFVPAARTIVTGTGSLSATVIPVPAVGWLFALCVGGLGLLRRRAAGTSAAG